jgi:hypothetical protein
MSSADKVLMKEFKELEKEKWLRIEVLSTPFLTAKCHEWTRKSVLMEQIIDQEFSWRMKTSETG